MLGARGITALSGRLKLSVARYAFVDPVLWNHLADFYGHAETHGYQNNNVVMYTPVPGATSVQREFAILLTWYGVSAGVLSPLQEHITERLIAFAGQGLVVELKYNGSGLFALDLSQPTPPMRVTSDSTVHRLCVSRCRRSAESLERTDQTLEKGIVPDGR